MLPPRRSHRLGGRPRRATLAVVVAALATMASVAGCGSSGTGPARGAPGGSGSAGDTIVIKNFAFSPANLSVSPGATVTVHNEDPTTHTVTATAPHDKAFNTGDIGANATVTFTAPTKAGSYPYICLIHQFMHGTLTVT